MASNDQWPPVASASKGTAKVNGSKRNIKDSQQNILSVVNEMFGSALEPDVILQVVQNCNWDLQPSIEGLITLTETVADPLTWNDVSENEKVQVQPADRPASVNKDVSKDPSTAQLHETSLGSPEDEYEPALPAKSEKPKRGIAKNRMGSFCGNIAKLKSSSENNTRNNETSFTKEASLVVDSNFFFDDMHHYRYFAKIFRETTPKSPTYGDLPDVTKPSKSKGIDAPAGEFNSTNPANWVQGGRKNSRGTPPEDSNRREKFHDTKATAENKEFNKPEQKVASLNSKSNMRKNESESLCGLKVQYRLSGMENSSDDDADVVIEDESSDYKINLASSMSISVCQFLSPSTQTPPQRTQPEIHMINVPSPPQTPQRNLHDATLNRIKAAIQQGSKIMILLRGLPGSGKSTLAKSIVAATIGGNSAAYVFNTDDFFVTLGRGLYQFDPTRIQDAHNTNYNRVWNALKEGRSPVIVDNTNIEGWEMRPYAAMAVENGYIVELLEPNTPWAQNVNELAKKNTHNIPKSKIRERYQRYERGLTGRKLLDKFSLKYSPKNTPPQSRRVPAIPAGVEPQKAAPTIADFKSNWGLDDKNNFVLTTRDIESMQSIDESHCAMGLMSECASVADDSSNSSNNPEKASNYGDKPFDDYLQELQNSDDESFEMLDGAASLHPADVGKSLDSKEESRLDSPINTPEVSAEEYVAGMKYSSPNGSQQILGAIGSERKGSLSVASSVGNLDVEKPEITEHEKNDNVLSQCSDFTLLLDRYKIHSRHNTYECNGEILHSNSTISQVPTYMAADSPDSGDEAKGDIISYSEVRIDSEKNCEPFVETKDKIIENIIKNDDGLLNDETLTMNSFVDNESFEIEREIKDYTQVDAEFMATERIEENIEVDSTSLRDASNTEDQVDNSSEKISENSVEIVEEPEVPSAFGSLLNLIKTSILGSDDEASSIDDACKILNSHEEVSACDTALQSGDYKDNDKDVRDHDEHTIKKDTVDFPCKSEEDEPQSCSEYSLIALSTELNDENVYPDLSTNPFRQEMLESQLVDRSSEDSQIVNDNINSISWKELPYPIDTKIPFPIAPPLELNKSVSKLDASTNTNYYDFNVSYVGGTSEPEYRVLSATSRCINQGNSTAAKIERPPLKLMLHKSSMTSEENILTAEPNLNPERNKDSEDRTQELIELFPHIPIESLTAFYVQQCKRNFAWAVEVLLDDAPNGFTLKGLEIKRPVLENDDANGSSVDSGRKGKTDHEKLKQRSHGSTPRHRRSRNKDFRSFSMDFANDRYWPTGESSNAGEGISHVKDDEDDAIFQQFADNATAAASLPVGSGEIPETSSEEDNEDEIELNFGQEFINQLEKMFGNPDFAFPDEFTPAIRITKSMAEELHALWIQSMYRQLNTRHAQLDEMIAKDEAIARALDRDETMEPPKEPVGPNFAEIMHMEMALASYKNELKEKIARETPNDMASRLTRQMLCESLPDIDPQTLSEILKAHGGNFKETCETIETSTGRKISQAERLKKQQSLLDRVNEESKIRGIEQDSKNTVSPLIVVRPDMYAAVRKSDKLSYKCALEREREARKEAEKQFSLRIDYFNKAAEAYRRGYPGVASYYSQMAKLHLENYQAVHGEAVEAFLSAQICRNDEDNTLDLHYLFVPEALQALDIFLEQQSKKLGKSNKRSAILYIITGRGARSNNGLSRIKPAVSKKLISRNIRFTEANPGCLKVTLSKKNGILD